MQMEIRVGAIFIMYKIYLAQHFPVKLIYASARKQWNW
jgi:hypothetical protein